MRRRIRVLRSRGTFRPDPRRGTIRYAPGHSRGRPPPRNDPHRELMKRILAVSLLAAGLAACDDSPSEPRGRVPGVGEEIQFNVQFEDNCSRPVMKTGRVAAVSNRAILVHDLSNPAGGFDDADYRELGAAFDDLVWPVDTRTFGEPGDVDGNGRVIFFFTRAINDLTPSSSSSYVNGLFYSRDLFPKRDRGNLGGCPSSNVAELIYMLAPDPARGGVFSRERVKETTAGVMAHEMQHLISASRRLYTLKVVGTDWNEVVWLNEGLSHIAEELVFYEAAGLTPRRNLDRTTLQWSARYVDAYNAFAAQNAGRYASFVFELAPERNSPFETDDDLATRGATWNFLRFAADRRNGDDRQLWNTLVNSRTTGMTNLRAALGTDPMPLFRDWAVSVYLDDAVAGVPAQFQQASWNFRQLFSSGLPLRPRRLVDGAPTTFTLDAGGTSYLRFGVGTGRAELRVTSGGNAPSGACAVVPTLAVGQVHTAAPAAGQALCVQEPGDYTLVAFYGVDTDSDPLSVEVTATGIQAVAPQPSPSVSAADMAAFAGAAPLYHDATEVRRSIRARERELSALVQGPGGDRYSLASTAPDPAKLYLSVARTR